MLFPIRYQMAPSTAAGGIDQRAQEVAPKATRVNSTGRQQSAIVYRGMATVPWRK